MSYLTFLIYLTSHHLTSSISPHLHTTSLLQSPHLTFTPTLLPHPHNLHTCLATPPHLPHLHKHLISPPHPLHLTCLISPLHPLHLIHLASSPDLPQFTSTHPHLHNHLPSPPHPPHFSPHPSHLTCTPTSPHLHTYLASPPHLPHLTSFFSFTSPQHPSPSHPSTHLTSTPI